MSFAEQIMDAQNRPPVSQNPEETPNPDANNSNNQGEPKDDDEPEDKDKVTDDPKPEDKDEPEDKDKVTDDPKPEDKDEPEDKDKASVGDDESDDDLLAKINKRTGKNFASLEDIGKEEVVLTDEEKAKQKEKFDNDAVAFALKENLVSRKELETFNVDNAKNPRELALEVFKNEVVAIAPDATDEEIEEAFKYQYGENEPEDSINRKIGESKIKAIAKNYINQKYQNVLAVPETYKEQLAVEAEARAYNTKVEKAISLIPETFEFQIDTEGLDGKAKAYPYSVKVSQDIVKQVRDEMLNVKSFQAVRQIDLSDEDLQKTMKNDVMVRQFPNIIKEVSLAHASAIRKEIEAGRKNVPVDAGGGSKSTPTVTPTKGIADAIMDGTKG